MAEDRLLRLYDLGLFYLISLCCHFPICKTGMLGTVLILRQACYRTERVNSRKAVRSVLNPEISMYLFVK